MYRALICWCLFTALTGADSLTAPTGTSTATIIAITACATAALLLGLLFAQYRHLRALHVAQQESERLHKELAENRKMFQLVMDNIPQFIFWKDAHSVYLGCNNNFATVAGVPPTESINGKTDFDLAWKKEEAEFFRVCDRRVMDSGEAEYHIIEPQLQADGKQAWLDTNKIPLRNDAGEVVGILGTFEDITARRLAEDAIRRSESDLRITLASIGDAVIATDDKGIITRMNPSAETLTCWSAAEAIGRPLMTVFHVIDSATRTPIEDPAQRVLDSGEKLEIEHGSLLIARDESECRIANSAAPIRNVSGDHDHLGEQADHSESILGVVIVFRNITDQYNLEEQLRQSEKMQAIGQLAGGVAHDFNNVLSGILGSAELLLDHRKDPERSTALVQSIIASAERAAELTSKLLDFSRKGKQRSDALDIHDLVREVTDILDRSIDKRIHISSDLEAHHSIIKGDSTQLQSALLNIGVNARDAMPDGGLLHFASSVVELDAEHCKASSFDVAPGPYIHMSIRDTGSGMTTAVMHKIFDPFFTTKEVGQGTGLGLAAVYGAVVDHHGAITVTSAQGTGTTFNLYLPLAGSMTIPANTSADVVHGTGCVLVIDDEEVLRDTVCQLLESLGYRVLVASDGQEGIELYRSRGYEIDAVMLDMVMPNMSGQECLHALRELNPAIKIIISSGFLRDARLEQMDHDGQCAFLPKPYRRADLGQALAGMLGR